jgi:hypothetical protein
MERTTWRLAACAMLGVAVCTSSVAGAYDTNLSKGAQYLAGAQAIDGSWQSAGSEARFLETAEAVLALQAANVRSTAYFNGLTWVQNHSADNTDYLSRRILALVGHGGNVRSDSAQLKISQSMDVGANGGYGLSAAYQGSVPDTALALQALKAIGTAAGTSSGVSFLKTAQRTADPKGWSAVAGGPFDATTTAHVLVALTSYLPDATLTTPISTGLTALKSQVTTSSPLRLRALTVIASIRAGATDAYVTGLVNSLTAAQNSTDGHWGTGAYDTALVMRALAAVSGKDLAADRLYVDVPDDVLRAAINEALGRNALDQLNRGELKNLTSLTAPGRGITDLRGLEYAINLVSADLSNNAITSALPVQSLPGYTGINLAGNPIATVVAEADSNAPLPLWMLVALGASLVGAVSRRRVKV